MFTKIVFLLSFTFLSAVHAASFKALVAGVDDHALVDAKSNQTKAIEGTARVDGSWGDPVLSVAAINYPKDTLARDESMMTGIQFGISQNLSFSGKYGKLEEAGSERAKAQKAITQQTKRDILKSAWELVIKQRELSEEKKILSENYKWLDSNLKITKNLYTNGQVPQQAVLDIQIRKSELSTQITEKKFELERIQYQLADVFHKNRKIDVELKSVPWDFLNSWNNSKDNNDFQEKAMKHKLSASELNLSAQKRNLIPDVTLGLTYTKRNDIDGAGDFVGASISFPLPVSSKKYAGKSSAVAMRASDEAALMHYRLSKKLRLEDLAISIKNLNNQIGVLNSQILKFAKSSRDVVSRSYSRGGTDYLELLRAELQYQKHRLRKTQLSSILDVNKLRYIYLKGGELVPRSML